MGVPIHELAQRVAGHGEELRLATPGYAGTLPPKTYASVAELEDENDFFLTAEAFLMTSEEVQTKRYTPPSLPFQQVPWETDDNDSANGGGDDHNRRLSLTKDVLNAMEAGMGTGTGQDSVRDALILVGSTCKCSKRMTMIDDNSSPSPSKKEPASSNAAAPDQFAQQFLLSFAGVSFDAEQNELRQPEMRSRSNTEFSWEDTEDDLQGCVWIPPRMQVYFVIHDRTVNTIESQNGRCYDCGKRIDGAFMRGARYCEYTGRYYCRNCHRNAKSVIPGHILTNWDFRTYRVSERSKEYLDTITKEPFFDVEACNPDLYTKVKPLSELKSLRIKLSYVGDFIYTCRHSGSLIQQILGDRVHLVNYVHKYSIRDFLGVDNGTLATFINSAINQLIVHVLQCEICKGKGFICEFCRSNEVLYPFQFNKVSQCAACKSFFHQKCYNESACPRCLRLEGKRLKSLSQSTGAGSNNNHHDHSSS